MHQMLRMPAVGSGESWKLLKQRHDLTDVYLTKITEGRLEDGGRTGRRVDGWLDRQVQGWVGVNRGMVLEAGGPIRR